MCIYMSACVVLCMFAPYVISSTDNYLSFSVWIGAILSFFSDIISL